MCPNTRRRRERTNAKTLSRDATIGLWWQQFDHLRTLPWLDSSCLSCAERERAITFKRDRDRQTSVLGRAFLRHVLGSVAGCAPRMVRFRYGALGKPEQIGGPAFNLSHTRDSVAIAVALGQWPPSTVLGLDIESLVCTDDALKLAPHCFSESERTALKTMRQHPGGIALAFTRGWTRKEALVKALGKGLHIPLDHFDVALDDRTSTLLLQSRISELPVDTSRVFDLGVRNDTVGALAVCGTRYSDIRIEQCNEIRPQ